MKPELFEGSSGLHSFFDWFSILFSCLILSRWRSQNNTLASCGGRKEGGQIYFRGWIQRDLIPLELISVAWRLGGLKIEATELVSEHWRRFSGVFKGNWRQFHMHFITVWTWLSLIKNLPKIGTSVTAKNESRGNLFLFPRAALFSF